MLYILAINVKVEIISQVNSYWFVLLKTRAGKDTARTAIWSVRKQRPLMTLNSTAGPRIPT